MKKYFVIYNYTASLFNMKIQQEMTQSDLSKLLADERVELISVNDSGQMYHRPRRKKGGD
jgi:hypothetical protein